MGNERIEKLAKERATLIALLRELPRGWPFPLPEVTGIERLSERDKMFITVTCCANIIAEIIWLQMGGERVSALAALDGLVVGIKENINKRLPFADEVLEHEAFRGAFDA